MKDLRLQRRHEKASSQKGRDRVQKILHATLDLIVEEGFSSLSMRKIAGRCDMTVGNLSYYYTSKSDLIHDLVDSVLQGYQDIWDPLISDETLTAEEKLIAFIKLIMEDLGTFETTRFFPELWVMATHDSFVCECKMEAYKKVRLALSRLLKEVNPKLTNNSIEALSVFISASMEGHTIFIGYNKSCSAYAPQALNIAVNTFVSIAKNLTNEQIQTGYCFNALND
jgi:AcrR family transcriptional regulator